MIVWIIVAHLHAGAGTDPASDLWVVTGKDKYYASQDACELVKAAAVYITPTLHLECEPLRPAGKE